MGRDAVLVVNYGAAHLLETHLGALGPADRGFTIVVVDNFSSAAERARVAELAEQWGWELVPEENRGFGAGMNAGARRALELGAETLVLLNPDVDVDVGVLRSLFAHVRDSPHDVVAPNQLRSGGRPGFARGTLDLRNGTTRTRTPLDPALEPWLSGACLAVSAELWLQLGGFDEGYFMYWEDLDLCLRARRHGAQLVVREDLVVQHDVGGTQGEGKSPLYRYYNCRNRLLFARRHAPRSARIRWLATTPRYAWRVLLRDGRRAVVRDPRKVGAVLTGSVAGIRIALLGR